ncbi:MAG: Glycosyl transferase, family 2 [Candidatus Roizmanbacteria bacterium GW2011_GWA2_37_7]|uniref:Glycosyl transferase, family 2 n=1 Tax=Candidatus Roizmanbacteria bacterium GW2011_GWA2_37_7 TaxID=1618481 RepID=A0A0G0HJU1_9BACT|nr:MAG: Glycosyl transferase, family 2 [Candidatus Roizmanbacteria bacterium GW2011_GWA2_37_7]
MKASVVIVTFKRPGKAVELTKAIRKVHKDIEIIIVDQENSSGISKSEQEKAQIQYFNLPLANISTARNKGWQNASNDIVIFLDDDVEITPKTIAAHIAVYDQADIVGVAGRVINDEDNLSENTGVLTGKTNILASSFLQQFWSTKKQYVDYVYGCNMSFRKSALQKVKGFDPFFNRIFDDVDIGRRIKKFGKILFEPKALLYHHKAKSGGTRTSMKDKMSMIYKNYGYFIAKHVLFPFSLITLLLRTRTALYEAPFAVKDLVKGYVSYIYLHTSVQVTFLSFAIIVILRLWKVAEFFSFNFDEEYQASLAWEQVKNFHPIWIGVSASNIGYYLGPGFTYLNAFLFKLSNGDPVSLAWFSALFGLITTISVYYITRELFNSKAALIAMTIYGGSAFLNFFDRRFWNPTPIPFITLWLVYSLIKGQSNHRWYILTALLVGASLNAHLALILLFPLVCISILFNAKKIQFPVWIGMGISYFFLTLPLLIFDFVHNFDNLRAPLLFIINRGSGEGTLSLSSITSHAAVFFQTLGRIWFMGFHTNIQDEQCLGAHCLITPAKPLLILVSVLLLGYYFWRNLRNSNSAHIYILSGMLLYALGFMFYSGYSAEYYLLGFFILFAVSAGWILSKIKPFVVLLLLSLFLIFNSYTVFASNQEQYGLVTRKHLIQKIMTEVGDSPYSLETYGNDPRKYHPYGGWRFLFKIYGKTPTQSFADEFFGWIYQDEITNKPPILRVVISDTIPYKSNFSPLKTFHEGTYYGYIFKI